jgi:hypothetical protein
LSEDKFLIVCKNNSGGFYWSQTIPEKYYSANIKRIIILSVVFSGGLQINLRNISKDFDNLLFNLLRNESELFMEEQIMSCLYYNNEEIYEVLKFDDWYKKEWHDENTSFFYELFLTEDST